MTPVAIRLSRGMVALVDPADATLVNQFRWAAVQANPVLWYARRSFTDAAGRRTSQNMHRLITGLPQTDHINGDGLDNRRANLRPAGYDDNARNCRKQGECSSRFKGVSWHGRDQHWAAKIRMHGRAVHLGAFPNEVEAAHAYDQAAREAHGEFAAVNFPRPGERSAISSKLHSPADTSFVYGRRKRAGGSSQFLGVTWMKQSSRWRARIGLNGHIRLIGDFRSESDAAMAYDAEARAQFGQYAALNFPGVGERSAITGILVGAR